MSWNSPEILAVCNEMREHANYDQLPVLADALVKAGCEDEDLLGRLHVPQTKRNAERIVCSVLGGEYWGAVEYVDDWVEQIQDEDSRDSDGGYANQLMTYGLLMDSADDLMGEDPQDHYSMLSQEGSMTWQDNFNGEKFKKAYALITGNEEARDEKVEFWISCSC